MSAAIEGAIEGIPAVGFSLDDFHYDADFEHTRPYLSQIANFVLKNGMAKGTALNVNFPNAKKGEIKGIKVCRQTNGYWQEEFDARKDPHGRPYYWMGGYFVNREPEATDNDLWALENNYISIVPCQYDLTNYAALDSLAKGGIES
jgi:5'-nucleotidase